MAEEEDLLTGIGEFVFSLVIGYFGALEFFFVVRQLVHWSGRHQQQQQLLVDPANAQNLDSLNEQLAAAQAREAAAAGLNVMQDGVMYANGFRVEPSQLNSNEDRKREIEAELARQKRIEEETRKQLAEAEAKLAAERRSAKEAEEKQKLADAEAERQKSAEAEAENTRKLLEAEKRREAEERQKEEEAEAERKANEENARKLLAAERERVEAERLREQAEHESAESERKLLAAETQRVAEQRRQEAEEEAQSRRDAEIVERLLEAERARKLSATESELEEEEERAAAVQARRLIDNEKQRLIDENARLFLEAEEEMVVLQQRLLEAAEAKAHDGEVPVVEEPCVKKIVPPKFEMPAAGEAAGVDDDVEPLVQKVKTQFGQQSSGELAYSLSAKPLHFPSLSDEGSSWEPISSQQSSSFSTQPSDEVTTGLEEAVRQRLETERQEPDGEDNVPDMQYTDDYLRSLDGIKSRSLMREDGSGRRRAFKKRRSSGSSNSSRESRASREEELKMFTSLEEEELRQGEKDDYNPIKYTSEPTLRVKTHHRRQKRSPAKDAKRPDEDSLRGSLEMLGEENTNPWGEVVPEHYKEMEFWKREKAMSIDEEEIDLERPASREEVLEDDAVAAINLPKASSFEEATHAQNEEAATALQQQQQQQQHQQTEKDNSEASKEPSSSGSDSKSNLQTSNSAEDVANARASSSPRLRRSPRIEEINQYEERWREQEADAAAATAKSTSSPSSTPSTLNSPSISISTPDTAPWRDSYGLIMEGISDFYDFQASTNPSRSRSTSRNPSPVNTAPSTPQPRNVAHEMDVDSQKTVDVYDDTDALSGNEINQESIIEFIESTMNVEAANGLGALIQQVADKPGAEKEELQTLMCESQEVVEHNLMIQTLREARSSTHSGSRSRSRSPLPTSENLERSISTRRERLIKHNDEIFEKLGVNAEEVKDEATQKADEEIFMADSPDSIADFVDSLLDARKSRSRSKSPLRMPVEIRIEAEELIVTERETEEIEISSSQNEMHDLVESLRAEQRTRSRSRSRSPLPTADNLERSIASRRSRLIQQNDELFEKLQSSAGEEDRQSHGSSGSPLQPPEIQIDAADVDNEMEMETETETNHEDIRQFIEGLRAEQRSRSRSHSRSRSRSPLPTADNLERSIATRRNRLIQQNDELFEKLASHENTNSPIEIRIEEVEASSEMETNQFELNVEDSKENMRQFVESLRAERRSHSRSRSRSPLPSADNIERSLATRRLKRIQQNDELFEKLTEPAPVTAENRSALPTICVECIESEASMEVDVTTETEEESRESMTRLVQQLRLNRSRSRTRSKTPLPSIAQIARDDEVLEQLHDLAQMTDSATVAIGLIYEGDRLSEDRDMRSLSPSRSRSPTPDRNAILANLSENYDFHVMLNLEASENKTLTKNSEEYESVRAAKQREVDLEALQKLSNASEEVELRLLSPTEILSNASLQVEDHMRQLRCSPTTPDYDRTISEECRDVERIKQEILTSGFKRSTYVGESLELGSEFQDLRRETANFQRSRSPSPAIDLDTNLELAKAHASAQQELQAAILDSLTTQNAGSEQNENRFGAKPKTFDYDRTISEEVVDTQRIKDELLAGSFKRSTYVGESLDLTAHLDDMRHRTAEFQRSRSQSRSPLSDDQVEALKDIEAEVAKRELEDQTLDQFTASTVNFQNFSRHLNVDFLDSERRASDSALIQRPDLLIQLKERESPNDLEPEEYHHFRRFSLAQEQPVEEYPNDDYVCISQIEVRTLTGTRTWLKEDFYSQELDNSEVNLAGSYSEESVSKADEAGATGSSWSNEQAKCASSESVSQELSDDAQYGDDYEDDDQEEPYDSNDSEDERQTVVEIEDEFDEGISDYNERGGPTDESHHETSECEEAEREADRYANRDANDWEDIENADEFLDYSLEEGAVGGVTPYSDPDSFIEQIYNEAIANRKQSGILRDYESIFQESQKTSESESDKANSDTDRSKVKSLAAASKSILESERRDGEMRYLGDANVSARQSTRLRSRYGYNPIPPSSQAEPNIEVDLDYKPKREYNWRKNFKLDDDEQAAKENDIESAEQQQREDEQAQDEQTNDDVDESLLDYDDLNAEYLDMRRYSLGGESITLFSRSPEHEQLAQVPEEEALECEAVAVEAQAALEPQPEPSEASETKVKKKKTKSKKKIRKSSKTEEDATKDEEDSENQASSYSRRSSSIQMDTDSPKRKSRSRRSSKSSLTNEESLFSPRSSLAFVDGIAEEESADLTKATTTTTLKKKTKKRKKSIKEEDQTDIKEEEHVNALLAAALAEIAPNSVSSNLTPVSTQQNALANLSAEQSVCVTPASIGSAELLLAGVTPSVGSVGTVATTTTAAGAAAATRPVLDSFDILKDANFYPLF